MAKRNNNRTKQVDTRRDRQYGKSEDARSEVEIKREQPRRDKRGGRRINLDNERVSRLYADIEKAIKTPGVHNNEIRFYNANPELLNAAGRIQFYNIVGKLISTELNYTGESVAPGVMQLVWSPQLGGYKGRGEVNRAANDMYSYVVHANSRNTSYNANDLMLMCLSVAEVYSSLSLGVKVYGCMREYRQENMYTPASIIAASGFDFSDLKQSYSHMWYDLNRLITQANTLWIPNDMPFVERRVWMNQHVFTDANGAKAQLYTFKPHNFYQYNETASEQGGILQEVFANDTSNAARGFTGLKWQQYVNAIDSMITALNQSEDRGVMMGDILKAYGTDRLFKFNPIPIEYVTPAVYDPLVLSQIESAAIFPAYTEKISSKVSDNIITAVPHYWAVASGTSHAPLMNKKFAMFNVHHPENPTVEEIVEISRLTAVGTHVYDSKSSGETALEPWTCGTESLCYAAIYYNVYQNTTGSYNLTVFPFTSVFPGASYIAGATTGSVASKFIATSASLGLPATAGDLDLLMRLYSSFDWAPLLFMLDAASSFDATSVTTAIMGINRVRVAFSDLDNYTVIDDAAMERINTTCLYSEFGLGSRK